MHNSSTMLFALSMPATASTQTAWKFPKLGAVSPASQGVLLRPKATAHTGYGIS